MTEQKIYWNKEYLEDIGLQDKDGFYDYAYKYHIYTFKLPDRQIIQARRYFDTPEECDLFDVKKGKTTKNLDYINMHNNEYIRAIANFFQSDGVKKVTYFYLTKGYCSIENTELKITNIKFEREEKMK